VRLRDAYLRARSLCSRPISALQRHRDTPITRDLDGQTGALAVSEGMLDPNRPVGAESRKTCAVKIASGFFDRYLSGNASGQTYHTLAIDKDLSRNSNMHCQGAKEAPLLPFNRAQALT